MSDQHSTSGCTLVCCEVLTLTVSVAVVPAANGTLVGHTPGNLAGKLWLGGVCVAGCVLVWQ